MRRSFLALMTIIVAGAILNPSCMHRREKPYNAVTDSRDTTVTESDDVGKLFNPLPSDPERISFDNELAFNNEGGHLQGIQPYYFKGEEYLFFSGSSSTYGYLAVAHKGKVTKLHRLMFKPFKHAGGFQIDGDWLAVGVEDNDARNASVVQIYRLGDPLSDLKEPVTVIQRSGERERATAGAVAVHQAEETLWVVVAIGLTATWIFIRPISVRWKKAFSFIRRLKLTWRIIQSMNGRIRW